MVALWTDLAFSQHKGRENAIFAVIHGNEGAKKLAPLCYQGSMKADRFERWFRFDLLKTIGAGKTIIMENASFHRKKHLNKICGKTNAGLLFLPPYSPDFNPIEKDWANMKRDLLF
ncbi:MAG: transposase [Treponema sp.]|nr:transposase [Treponema sp.]